MKPQLTSAHTLAEQLRAAAPRHELAINSEHRLRMENLSFDIDVWYRRLCTFTFPTSFLPLDLTEAAAIVRNYDVVWRGHDPLTTMHPHDVRILQHLEQRIDFALESFPNRDAFVRLCGRSPKDGEPRDPAAIFQAYQGHLTNTTQVFASDPIPAVRDSVGNTKLVAATRTSTLRVRSGKDTLALLLSSERVFLDCVDWLKHGEPEQICLRQWEDRLCIENEFRCFVHDGKMTAISQYDPYPVLPHQLRNNENKKKLEKMMKEFWKKLHPSVGVASYVCDLGWLPPVVSDSTDDDEVGEIVLVEIAPFLPCTGPALFKWTQDKDVLFGRSPFEFRTSESVRPQLEELVEMTWEERFRNPTPGKQYDRHWDDVLLQEGGGEGEEEKIGSESEGEGVVVRFLKQMWSSAFDGGDSGDSGNSVDVDGENSTESTEESFWLFVYGTLKENFHWHDKFLSRECRGVKKHAITSTPWPLIVGESGVPYLVANLPCKGGTGGGKRVRGELWKVTASTMARMDAYEGVDKGYYERRKISVVVSSSSEEGTSSTKREEEQEEEKEEEEEEVWVYMLAKSMEWMKEAECLDEYTLEMHDAKYNPIRHILIKQEGYLEHTNSTWGLSDDAFHVYEGVGKEVEEI